GMERLEPRHVELARAISAVAQQHQAVADRSRAQEVQLAVAAHPQAVNVGFWRAVLGYAELADDNGVDPLGHGSTVWLQGLDEAKPLRHAMHVDVSVAREHAHSRRAAASSTTRTPRRTGYSPTPPATGCASVLGRTVPPGPVRSASDPAAG